MDILTFSCYGEPGRELCNSLQAHTYALIAVAQGSLEHVGVLSRMRCMKKASFEMGQRALHLPE